MPLKRLAAALLSVLLAAGCAAGGSPGAEPRAVPQVQAVVGATVLPMSDAVTVLREHTVLMQGGRIIAVGPSTRVRPPAGAQVIDGRGRWVIPGLTDAHVHLEYIEQPDVLKLFVAEGVTTVRSMDGRPFILDWRRGTADGSLVGPRIYTAGPIIDGAPPLRPDNLSAATPEAARAAVRAQAEAGYDFIKLYTNLTPEAWRAAVEEARARDLPVTGHVPRGVDMLEAARVQRSIEHLGDFGRVVDPAGLPGWSRRLLAGRWRPEEADRLAAALARTDAWIVPTLVERERALPRPGQMESWSADPAVRALPEESLGIWRGQVARSTARMDANDWAIADTARGNRLQLLAALRRAGVKIALGTDTPNAFVAPGGSVHHELTLMVEAGFTPGQALYAATGAASALLGPKHGDAGVIAPGRRADVLVLAADPFADVGAARSRVGLFLNGRWYEESALQALRGDLQRGADRARQR